MSILERVKEVYNRGPMSKAPPPGSYASLSREGMDTWGAVTKLLAQSNSPEARMVKEVLERRPQKAAAISLGVPDLGFKGIRQQLFQRFNLVDLYVIAHNSSVVKTAITNLKDEVFRRGLKWEPAYTYRNTQTGVDVTMDELIELKETEPEEYESTLAALKEPDGEQRIKFEQVIQNSNFHGQTLMDILQEIEDDMNIVDDGFLFLSSDYYMGWSGEEEVIKRDVRQLFRLDPTFIEYDTDIENRAGFAHHICLMHRDDLLDIPTEDYWIAEWEGVCPKCGHTTFPVVYRYLPFKGTFGVRVGLQGPDAQALYLVKGEVIHTSKFSPSALYGYSPILSLYEKALSLIGMDRYLYDYFFERIMPQGIVTTVTDDPHDLEARMEQMKAEMLANPHHLPWMAVSSKTGQGKTEFVRFAYSLDELQFLPVQQQIEKSIAALYGVPDLFMGDSEGSGGLNNESQQLTRMSRGAQRSQSVYNTKILPQLLDAFGITDWLLALEDAEERTEQFELELRQRNAQWAQTVTGMGFGAKYDQDTDTYEIYGEVKPQSEQEDSYMGGEGGGFDDFGDEGDDSGGFGEGSPYDMNPEEPEVEGEPGYNDTRLT